MNITFDTQTAVIDLRLAGYEDSQAQAIVNLIKNSQAELVSKRDFDEGLRKLKFELIIALGSIIVASFGVFTVLLTYIVR
jgi:hypothetical protein